MALFPLIFSSFLYLLVARLPFPLLYFPDALNHFMNLPPNKIFFDFLNHLSSFMLWLKEIWISIDFASNNFSSERDNKCYM